MKKTRNKTRGVLLQKSNKRWKWMAGATAATAAGVTASQASTITINLVNNYISGFGGNHLNADLTGDGHPDFTLANAFHSTRNRGSSTPRSRFYVSDAGVTLNGVRARAHWYDSAVPDSGTAVLGSRTAHFYVTNGGLGISSFGTPSLTGSIPLFFKDLHINGGAPTMGSLQVTVSARGAVIQLDSFTYNSNTATLAQASRLTVPDQGSSLALLAMGAGGVLAFRRWRATQGQS